MNAAKRYEIFARLKAENPKPETELEYRNPFELLVAVTLSAQATDVGVNKATRKLFPVANTPETIYALGVDGQVGSGSQSAIKVIAPSVVRANDTPPKLPRDRPGIFQRHQFGAAMTAGVVKSAEIAVLASHNQQ